MIDLIASRPQYEAHALPAWLALPDEFRGDRPTAKEPTRHPAALVASAKDLATARRRGYRSIAYIEHGIGQSYGNSQAGYPGGRGRDAVSLFLSPNETAAARDRAAYPAARVDVAGDPRLDTLPAFRSKPGTIAISFHWNTSVAPETRPAFPHYRDVIPALAGVVPLIAHAHPKASGMERVYRKLGVEFVQSFDEVLERASLYVCDNSSTLYEFASTGRPVVVLNAPWFRRGLEAGLRFWAAADVGIQVDDPEQLEPAIRLALTDPPEQRHARNAALELVYGYRSGAAARAAAAIADWLAETQERAA